MKTNPTIVPVAHIIELGKATSLTLGGNGKVYEYMRPDKR